jgi:hypothetical protein
MEDTIAEKLATIAENEQNVFNAGYEKGLASGGVPINNQDKTITENGVYQADEGYTGLGTVTVEVASTGGGDIDALIDRSITEITSNAVSVGDYALQYCNSLKTVNFPLVTSIGFSAFKNCNKLETLNCPSLTKINQAAFENCYSLKTVNFPLVTSIDNSIFYNCSSLETFNFPLLTKMGSSAFYDCRALKMADFPLVTSIGGYTFYNCGALSSLIIRSETMCALSNKSAFNSSSVASGTGYIYVPKSLLSDDDATKDYRRATNWSNYATQFRALEDYTVDGTINGELDESKI